jgi:hypothetical protein
MGQHLLAQHSQLSKTLAIPVVKHVLKLGDELIGDKKENSIPFRHRPLDQEKAVSPTVSYLFG